jgi:hypothetical protein
VSLTYGDILRSARDASAFFDPTRISGGPAIRMAADIQRDLVGKLLKRNPEQVATTATLTSATVVAALGVPGVPPLPVTIPAAMRVVRMQVAYPTGQPRTLIAITPDETREYEGDLAWFTQGGSAYFTGYASDWTAVQSVIVTYVPYVSDLATEADALVLPDDAKWAFTQRLAYAFALRVNGMPMSTEQPGSTPIQLDINAFSAEAAKAESAWLAQITDQRRAMSRHPIREG